MTVAYRLEPRPLAGCAAAAGLLATIIAANAALLRWGLIPIGFGLTAPAGVMFAGLAFGLRDVVHETIGRRAVYGCIVAGTALSYWVAPAFAVASAAAFLLSETADLAVYAPLRARHWVAAVAASNLAGTLVDSALFLWLAFGSLDYLAGQIVGKTYMTAAAIPAVWVARNRVSRRPT